MLTTKDKKGKYRIAFIGECMIELKGRPLESISQTFSGDTANTAVYFSRLTGGQDVEIDFVTAVGDDPFSDAMLQFFSRENLGCGHIQRVPGKQPGLYFINVDPLGERSFYYWRNASAARDSFELPESEHILESLSGYDAVYLSGISLAIIPPSSRNKLLTSLEKLKANGGNFFFDNNYRPKLWDDKETAIAIYQRFMNLCDLALLTLDDEEALYGEVGEEAVFTRCNNIPEVVVKRGAKDCLIRYRNEQVSVPAQKVSRVVDTTAAGDSFGAAYLAARVTGCTPVEAAVAGHQLASTVIQYEGAIIDNAAMSAFEYGGGDFAGG